MAPAERLAMSCASFAKPDTMLALLPTIAAIALCLADPFEHLH
jgi:hypothetical protein